MPKYDYQCRSCGINFEVEQRITEARLTTCKECGEDALERLIGGGVGIIDKSASAKPPSPCPGSASCPGGACPYAGQ